MNRGADNIIEDVNTKNTIFSSYDWPAVGEGYLIVKSVLLILKPGLQ